jgi:glycosyltransferase involved in cell wall biosynthesis
LNPALPPAYHGERKKSIVSFCRITPQKNLKLLIDAYAIVCNKYPDYCLEIYGDGEGKAELLDYLKMKQLDSRVDVKPFDATLHKKILDNAMFVSSSDYEGMSNSMLEAMAIGLPTICTDCPAGGARAIIRDHENGLLVPVRNVQALANAMLEMIENPSLAQKLSENGALLREELNVETIAKRWMELL